MAPALEGQVVPVAALGDRDREAMFALMNRYYDGVRRSTFEADLSEKQWAIRVDEPATGRLVGFSTQMLIDFEVEDCPVRALFSGDTIVDRDWWGRNPLAGVWGRLALRLIESTDRGLYWFLVSKGYKTYRFLPVFFQEFYPRFDRPTSAWAAKAIEVLAARKFGRRYDSDRGVVRAAEFAERLRQGIADLDGTRRRDPHVAYFAARNPNHASGEELCCLAPLTQANFTPAAWRVIEPAEPVAAVRG